MIVETSRFGQIEIEHERVITFPTGLLGFPQDTQYVLLRPADDGFFFWLQSLQTPELAFVVTDPVLFVPDYRVTLRAEQMLEMELERLEDAQVLVIVNKRGDVLTGNLQGPLVVHAERRMGRQLVISEKRWDTRVTLADLGLKAAVSA